MTNTLTPDSQRSELGRVGLHGHGTLFVSVGFRQFRRLELGDCGDYDWASRDGWVFAVALQQGWLRLHGPYHFPPRRSFNPYVGI
jgi:hypothetical protein